MYMKESQYDRLIFIMYGPLSIAYIKLYNGHLFYLFGNAWHKILHLNVYIITDYLLVFITQTIRGTGNTFQNNLTCT